MANEFDQITDEEMALYADHYDGVAITCPGPFTEVSRWMEQFPMRGGVEFGEWGADDYSSDFPVWLGRAKWVEDSSIPLYLEAAVFGDDDLADSDTHYDGWY